MSKTRDSQYHRHEHDEDDGELDERASVFRLLSPQSPRGASRGEAGIGGFSDRLSWLPHVWATRNVDVLEIVMELGIPG